MNATSENATAAGNVARRPWLRRLRRIVVVLLATYLAIVVLLMIFEESLIFFPSKYPEGEWNPPGLNVEDAWLTAADGTKLHGWYVPCDRPRAVVLFAHGNAGNISHRAELLRSLAQMDVTVLAFDYRGYGRSTGTPNEKGVLADARAARNWLAERAGVSEREIVLMGESLGGGVVVALAAEAPARGLILENTFSSIPDVAAFHYPGLPVQMLMRTRLDSAAAIQRYHDPLLQFHGDRDSIVPFALGRKLFDAANEPKKFVAVAGGDHNDPRGAEFYQELDRFLEELPGATKD
ncbi:MAG: alpha/beta hydrolase [Pirellulales bacterium]|nr:alpha/beta hydrolase [Pirellulales bacterium]